MTIFGMPPDDPEGLRPGVDENVLGFGDQGDSLADDADAPEAVRDPAGLANDGPDEDPAV